mmetsp:Transcript_12299/g.28832  ORF Transcript_12299/g.28832 Transcript_12299/m.28832 type:complete len:210 (+) Transcript_12299:3663-4292(+)
MPGGHVASSLWASLGASRSNQYPNRTDRTTRPFWFIREIRLSQTFARHKKAGGMCPPSPRLPGPTAMLLAHLLRTARPALAPSPPLRRLKNQRFNPRRAPIRTSFSILGSMRLALLPNGVSSRLIMLPPFPAAAAPLLSPPPPLSSSVFSSLAFLLAASLTMLAARSIAEPPPEYSDEIGAVNTVRASSTASRAPRGRPRAACFRALSR